MAFSSSVFIRSDMGTADALRLIKDKIKVGYPWPTFVFPRFLPPTLCLTHPLGCRPTFSFSAATRSRIHCSTSWLTSTVFTTRP